MYNYLEDLNKVARAEKKRWNGKVITTGKQCVNNDNGSKEVMSYSFDLIFDAYQDWQDSRRWN